MKMDANILNSILRVDFVSYINKCFYHLLPNREFYCNWHIDYIAESLMQTIEFKVQRIIINIPPRHLKSIIVSIAWPSWILGHFPEKKIIVVSYSKELSKKHSLDTRSIMQSRWYKRLFPNTKIGNMQNTCFKFITTMYGFRFATSINGTLTGEGADYIIVDDPHNPVNISSDKIRINAINWFENVLVNRLNNRKEGVIIIVMQRLHELDLSGFLIKYQKHRWKLIVLPIFFYEASLFHLSNKIIEVDHGDVLNSSMYNAAYVDDLRKEVGKTVFFSQYMQMPITGKNAIIKSSYIGRYSKEDDDLLKFRKFISWDLASCKENCNSYSVATVWANKDKKHYLLDVVRVKKDFISIQDIFKRLNELWSPIKILIEDKSSGEQLGQLFSNSRFPVTLINPVYSKYDRLTRVVHFFEKGEIFLPLEASWLDEFEVEIFTFPNSKNSDQVDSVSQYLNWFMDNNHVVSYNITCL